MQTLDESEIFKNIRATSLFQKMENRLLQRNSSKNNTPVPTKSVTINCKNYNKSFYLFFFSGVTIER